MRRTRFDTDPCPIARVADLFGDWWTPIILRDALFGVQRFEDFQKNLDVSRATLSSRLTRLVYEGLMERVAYQQRPVRHEYVLTEKGRAASDVLIAMWRYGEDHFWPERDVLHSSSPSARVARRFGPPWSMSSRRGPSIQVNSRSNAGAADNLCRPLCRAVDRCHDEFSNRVVPEVVRSEQPKAKTITESSTPASPAMNGRNASHHGRIPPATAD